MVTLDPVEIKNVLKGARNIYSSYGEVLVYKDDFLYQRCLGSVLVNNNLML